VRASCDSPTHARFMYLYPGPSSRPAGPQVLGFYPPPHALTIPPVPDPVVTTPRFFPRPVLKIPSTYSPPPPLQPVLLYIRAAASAKATKWKVSTRRSPDAWMGGELPKNSSIFDAG